MPMYRLHTLGTLGVSDGSGRPVEFPVGKPLALLIRLAVSQEPPTRRDLVHLLWSRSSAERGLHSVRQALWLIRRTLGAEVLEADDVVRLGPGAVTCDVAELERALAENRVTDADGLWRGPFLHRFAVADAPEWDRWVESVGESLSERLTAAIHGRALDRREAGDLAGARRGLERSVEIAPFDMRYRVDLVSCLVDQRDVRAAETALAEARRAAPEPDAGLERLATRVEQLRAERGGMAEERLSRPDLVGRSAELAELVAAWRQAEQGSRRIVLLTGPVGIGKTRLAEELARTLQHEGALAVTVRAAEVERAMEHGVIASLARALLPMPGAAGISMASDALLGGLAPSLPGRRPSSAAGYGEHASPVALADALADLMGAVAYERPLLITLDDAGWADAPSVSVLARAFRTLREGSVMLVLAARTPGGVSGVLRPLESIGGDVAITTIRLRPLSRAETQALVGLLVDRPGEAGTARLLERILATTGGNPLFVIELIRAFLGGQLIATEEGRLIVDLSRLEAELAWPGNVRGLVRRRFERLTPGARSLGHLLATVSPPDPETAARRLAGLSRRAYSLAVAELVEHGIVAWDGSRLAFTHVELREAAAAWAEEGEGARSRPVGGTGGAGEDRIAGGAVEADFIACTGHAHLEPGFR